MSEIDKVIYDLAVAYDMDTDAHIYALQQEFRNSVNRESALQAKLEAAEKVILGIVHNPRASESLKSAIQYKPYKDKP